MVKKSPVRKGNKAQTQTPPPPATATPAKSSGEPCKTVDGKPCAQTTQFAASGVDPDSIKKRVLPGPTQSPRDPNLYRVLRLENGIRIALSSTCQFSADEIVEQQKKLACKCQSTGRIKSGTRSKCKRTVSDFEAPNRKVPRPEVDPLVKDSNCVDENVRIFNKEVLHLCTTEAECPKPTVTSEIIGWLNCCTPAENMSVEEQDNASDPADDITPETPLDDIPEQPKLNRWSKSDRLAEAASRAAEDDDEIEPKVLECARGQSAEFSLCSVAITVPWGQIFESDEVPGVSELCRNCIKGCDNSYSCREEEYTTFVAYLNPGKDQKGLVSVIECMANKFYGQSFDKACVDKALKLMEQEGSYADQLRKSCWKKGFENLLVSPKRIKLLSLLTKEDHPLRRCALGGKSNKKIQEANRPAVDRAMNEYLRNACKPQFISVAVEAPENLDNLEEAVITRFGRVGPLGQGKPAADNPAPAIEGESDPFDTEAFRKLYKVRPCPEKCEGLKCHGHSLILSFPLPSAAWKNYKTNPLLYLSHVVGHKGPGSLRQYLFFRNWITHLRAECSPTQFHRSQFCSLFEICIGLTDEGFQKRLEVLQATFGYLKMLAAQGPQKRIYKELQKIQAIEFHALGKNLEDIRMIRDARHLSKGLQIAKSEDVITSETIMTNYNGKLLSEYLNLLNPEVANIMVVSNSFDDSDITLEEPYLLTKYGVQDIPPEWMAALKSVDVSAEFALPGPNPFIPDYFCLMNELACGEKIERIPIHLSGDTHHDLWYLRDPRYGTRAGAIIHFATPLANLDLESACKMTLFHRMFKALMRPIMYQAEIAHAEYALERTDFGIMVRVEANHDKLHLIIGTMADKVHNMLDFMTPEFFENQRTSFRRKICCKFTHPTFYTKWLHNALVLHNAWCPTTFLPVLDDLTLEDMKEFIELMKKDLFFMLFVVGNATKENARELCEGLLGRLNRTAAGKAIEQVEILQWPIGENLLQVKGIGDHQTRLMSMFYQMGTADSTTIVMAALIEPMLQEYFLKCPKIVAAGLFVMVGGYQLHNILELHLQVQMPDTMDPLKVNDLIEAELENFRDLKLYPMKPKDLDEMKAFYLCSCQPTCGYFSPDSNLKLLSHGVHNLNMNAIGVEVQKQPCECMTVKDLRVWFKKYFLEYNEDGEKEICASEIVRRKLTIIVMNDEKKKPVPEAAVVDDPKKKKKIKKMVGSPCDKHNCPSLDIENMAPFDKADECDPNVKKRKPKANEEPFDYIYDLEFFKGNSYIYPSYIPRN